MSNFSTSRYESENRRYQRTAQTMISGSKCRHLNSAGRGLIMEYTAAYQTHPPSLCNTVPRVIVLFVDGAGLESCCKLFRIVVNAPCHPACRFDAMT